MEIAELASIDWCAPWLTPIAEQGRTIATAGDWRKSLNEAAQARQLCNASGQRIAFSHENSASDDAYETHIARTGSVPTRANLHDLFNALMFLQFPRSKARLNWLQANAIERDGVRAVRGPVRDASTLIDENGVLLITDRLDIVDSLRRRSWDRLFLGQRAEWAAAVRVVAFGHALLEKLQRPYKGITAHALHLALPPASSLSEIDRCMAAGLDEHLTPQALLPLPVLGIPGWWAPNENPDFYADPGVFRPAKMRPDCKAEMDS